MKAAATSATAQQTADVLRRLLEMVERGELDASGRRGKAVVARLEGVLLGLDVASGREVQVRGP
jgi:2-keto-3-deoxy-galactonokinase